MYPYAKRPQPPQACPPINTVCMYVYVCMHVCIYVCMHVCIYIYFFFMLCFFFLELSDTMHVYIADIYFPIYIYAVGLAGRSVSHKPGP